MVVPADIYVLAGLVSLEESDWTLRELADKLFVDHTLIHRVLKRAEEVELYSSFSRQVHLPNFEELLIHAVRFIAPAQLGAVVAGVPAAWATKPIVSLIHSSKEELPPVWPSARGHIRGQSFEPLHPAAVQAVDGLPQLGELLSIIDSLRTSDLRIRKVAAKKLHGTLRASNGRRKVQA